MAVFAALSAAEARAAEEVRVVDVQVVGLKRMTESQFLSRIRTKKGEVYSRSIVSQDVTRLARQGIIVSADEKPAPGGVIVVFTVKAEEEFREVVKVKGVPSALKEIVQTKKGARLTEFMLRADSARIRDHYVEKGYHEASVKYDVEAVNPSDPSKVKVIFTVTKGPKFRVYAIVFVGNHAFSDKKLKKVIRVRKRGMILFGASGIFIQREFDEDIARLNEFYRSEGYLDATVRAGDVQIDFTKGRVKLLIEVHEGERYKVASVAFEGNEAVSSEKLASLLKMKEGSYLSQEEASADRQALYTYYTTGGRGYASVEITPQLTDGPEPFTKALTYKISEGKPTYIRRIETRGNYKTRPKVIIREMRIEPGELYDSSKVRDSERRLYDMRYFDKVDTELKDAPPPEFGAQEGVDYKDLMVKVEEATTGAFSVGAGFSTNSQLVGRVMLEQRNFDISNLPDFRRYGLAALDPSRMFVGGGQRLLLMAEPGSQRKYYTFEFEDPWFFDYPVDFLLSGYFYERYFDDYTVERLGGSVGFGRRFARDLKLSLRYRRELVTVKDINEKSPIEAAEQSGQHDLGSWRAGLNYDKRDSTLFPTRGFQTGTYGELAGPPAGGDVDFWKAGLNGEWYRKLYEAPIGTPHVLRLAAQSDFSGGAFGAPSVPIYERFFAGGIGTMRGFAWQGVGPHQTEPPTGNTPIGGQFLFLATAEYIIPLYKEAYQLYIFNDAGTLTQQIRATAFDELRDSVGIGIRLTLPALNIPLTMNLGVPVRSEPRDKIQNFNFALGLFF